MKRSIIFWFFSIVSFILNAQTTYTVNSAGLTFSPSTVNCKVGDIIHFNSGDSHPVVQVSQATWNANGSTALAGGFNFPTGVGDYTATTVGTIYFVCTAHVSSGMKGQINVSAATAIRETSAENDFRIFPNPAYDYLNFHNSNSLVISDIRILDVTGRTVLQILEPVMSDEVIRLDIGNLKKGIYFISLKKGTTRVSQKFMKL